MAGLWPPFTFKDVWRDRRRRLWLLLLGPILLRRWALPEPPAGRLLLLEVRAIFCFLMLLLSTGLTLVLWRRPMGGCGSWGWSWLRYWLDEPEWRFIEWRLDADPECRWCRLVELDRRFSAKLFRLLLPDCCLARFVVLDRMRLSVLSPPMAPPYDRRCLSRSRLLVPDGRWWKCGPGWIMLLPLALRLIRNVAVLMGAGTALGRSVEPNWRFSYTCESPDGASGTATLRGFNVS